MQRILKDRGIKHVTEMGRAQNENYAPPVAVIPRAEDEVKRRERQDWPEAELPSAQPREAGPVAVMAVAAARAGSLTGEPRPMQRSNLPAIGSDGEQRLQAVLRDLLECKRILDGLQ